MNSLVRLGVSPAASTLTGFFSVRGFEALFPCTGTLVCVVCLPPQLFLPAYLHANGGPPALLVAASPVLVLQLPPCHKFSPPQLLVSTPPARLGECFFFKSLLVGLPCSSIFCQFWFFVFKFVVLLLVVQGGKVCLPMPPSLLEVISNLKIPCD